MMSTGNAMSDTLDEVLDAAAAESDAGKLDDAEIQRLVALSRDASYRRTERVPVKSVEAFEPRSLVSIAMAAQRRREEEMSLDSAAAATADTRVDASNVTPFSAALPPRGCLRFFPISLLAAKPLSLLFSCRLSLPLPCPRSLDTACMRKTRSSSGSKGSARSIWSSRSHRSDGSPVMAHAAGHRPPLAACRCLRRRRRYPSVVERGRGTS